MDDRERKPYIARIVGLGIVVVLIFSILGFNLWHLQISQGSFYAAKAQGNAMKLVKVPPTRGDIVDRNGKLLVTSVPEFVLNLDWLDLQLANSSNWKDVVRKLAGYIEPYWPIPNQSIDSITEDILVNIQNHQWERYRPVVILDNVPPELQASIAEHQEELPGVSVDAIPVREYPQKILAGQLLGFVREISDTAEIDQFNKNPDAQKAGFEYAQGDMVGKDGVEKSYDFWLRGIEGVQQIEVDNNARPLSKKIITPSQAGKTVQLTIDADLQKVVEDSLDDVIATIQQTNPAAHAGAAVVIDVNTGKILAMVSRPGMDPNELTGSISDAMVDKYWPQDPKRASQAASLNRALSGVYPPGSVFKMVVAMAALKLNLTTPYEQIDDRMSSLGDRPSQQQGFPEWGGNYFGLVNMYKGLAKSSDIYFEVMGRRVFDANTEVIKQISNEFGLGVENGIDLPGESKGTAPSAEWKKAYYGPTYEKSRDNKLATIESDYAPKLADAADAKAKQKVQAAKDAEINKVNAEYKQNVSEFVDWKVYDSYNNSIGQGDNSYSPLQLANYISTMVNGGKRFSPYVVDKLLDPNTGETVLQNEPKVLNTVSVSPEILGHTKQGMRAVVTGSGTEEGTAKFIFSDLSEFTGGAKTGTAQIGNVNTELGEVFNGMFVAFAPYDNPQIAFAGVVESGKHGGDTAGYVAKAAFMQYFGWKTANGS
ncbi:penicillin-binding protein 2 [Desulfosporosinus fructosivorans]|uniref:Penicillin-binding protein 2 n=1 Tax=Desulfosporosinus fructosivorans TaxID=2018669 RepID=A0A4Z0RCM2_9FIRM|nr:penicillin-binding protein 2 [Desulfosporosinus fructosivorans]TGE39713.1 penicillin-binding protein 2 [Desulfosporosinus fructosivorans]